MSFKNKVVFYVCCAGLSLFYPLLSGRADGFVAVRALLIPVPLFVFFVFLADVISCLWHVLRKKVAPPRGALKLLLVKACALAFCVFSLVASAEIDRRAIKKTQDIGDALIQEIGRYYETQGILPTSLDEEPFTYYTPVLANSTFWIEAIDGANFHVGFGSVLFMICTKGNHDKDWICDD